MEAINSPFYDPYRVIPFRGYKSASQPLGDHCVSLMHFIESEKYRGIDDSYRQYLLTLTDHEDFTLETIGVGQAVKRHDWEEVKGAMFRAGFWMQLFQRVDEMRPYLLQPNCQTGIPLLDGAAWDVYQRLTESTTPGNELRRVVIAGDVEANPTGLLEQLNQLFSVRLPDEVVVTTESGVADLVHDYCLSKYLPVRCISVGDSRLDLAVDQALNKATHVFVFSQNEASTSKFAEDLLDAATAAGKISHRIARVE